MFHVGQVVVCVDTKPENGVSRPFHEIVEGGVYTVRWVGEYEDALCIRLAEVLRATPCPYRQESDVPFLARRFRPAVKTDISTFTEMLTKQPQSKQVDA